MTEDKHTINASGKRLGRLASDVAILLMGKHRTDAARHTRPVTSVVIEHAGQLHINERKRANTVYDRYSGYPDGRHVLTMKMFIERKGYAELVRQAVYGMLPNNRLRAKRMKLLTVHE